MRLHATRRFFQQAPERDARVPRPPGLPPSVPADAHVILPGQREQDHSLGGHDSRTSERCFFVTNRILGEGSRPTPPGGSTLIARPRTLHVAAIAAFAVVVL